MPPGKPVANSQASLIAAYMHGDFYSPVAQERNRPARLALTRLTVKQLRNAIADLMAGSPQERAPSGTGLTGSYFRGRDGASKAFDRIDKRVDFDFGDKAPSDDKFDAHNFTITWQGSLIAPDSGDYEFVVRTDQATRLWFNGEQKPLIDAWVKSGSDTEFKGSVRLLAGRAYPLRLDFSKATQGVNDDAKKKNIPPGKAFIRLLWSPPKQPAQAIPTRFLLPTSGPPAYLVNTPFPADDRSLGYERGNDISKEFDEATTSAAIEAARFASENLAQVTGIAPNDPNLATKLRDFCGRFLQRAFRRPLSDDMKKLYLDRQFEGVTDPLISLRRVVMLALKSPRFLYREAGMGKADPYAIASKLSFGLWDSIPDQQLLDAAASGGLKTPELVKVQAERLAASPRAWSKLRDFLYLWLKVDDVPTIVKNNKSFPEFDTATSADLRTAFDLFLESTAWSASSDFRELFLSKTTFLNRRLGKLYGANLPDDDFKPVTLDGGKRFGVLTSPYLLSRFAYLETTSPIHRGVLIAKNLLGRTLNPPPAAFTPLAPSLHPSLTTRERVTLQTKPEACNTCHSLINPLGFSLEGYDAVGRIRSQENGKGVDASGYYKSRSGETVKFRGAADLAQFLASNEETQAAFTEKLFHHLVKQPILAFGPKMSERLRREFVESRYSIRKLMVSIMVETSGQESGAKL
jgi:hypothetical protein